MSNPDLGHCRCPVCGNNEAAVRKASTGRGLLYLYCTDCSGPLFLRLPKGQAYILDNARMFGPEGKPEPKPAPAAAPPVPIAAKPAPAPAAPPPKPAPKSGLAAWLP